MYNYPLSAARILIHSKAGGGRRSDAYTDEVAADNPVSLWDLDSANGDITISRLEKSLAQTNAAPAGAAASLVPSTGGGAGAFAGASVLGLGTEPAASALGYVVGTQYSVEAWFKTNNAGGNNIFHRSSNAGGNRFVLNTESGRVVFRALDNPVTLQSPLTTYADNLPHHVVATQDSTTLRLYVDGALVASGARTPSGMSQQILYMGWARYGGGGGYQMTGSIDELATYDYALSDARVLAHYEAAAA